MVPYLFENFVCFTSSQVSHKLLFPITSSYSSLYTTWKIIELMREKTAVANWLSSVKSLLPVTTQVPAHVFLLLAYLLIQEKGDSLHDVLQATEEIAKADCSQVKTLLVDFVTGIGLDPATRERQGCHSFVTPGPTSGNTVPVFPVGTCICSTHTYLCLHVCNTEHSQEHKMGPEAPSCSAFWLSRMEVC